MMARLVAPVGQVYAGTIQPRPRSLSCKSKTLRKAENKEYELVAKNAFEQYIHSRKKQRGGKEKRKEQVIAGFMAHTYVHLSVSFSEKATRGMCPLSTILNFPVSSRRLRRYAAFFYSVIDNES